MWGWEGSPVSINNYPNRYPYLEISVSVSVGISRKAVKTVLSKMDKKGIIEPDHRGKLGKTISQRKRH